MKVVIQLQQISQRQETIILCPKHINQILTIRMKAQDLCDQSNEEDVDDGRGVDDLDENEEADGDCLQLEPSEIAAISSSKVRKYILPKINFKAETYTELIDWETSQLSEPPFTLNMTNEQLTSVKDSPLEVPAYPCHTQAVERAIRLVTEASSSVIGHEAREGFIRQRILARKGLKGHLQWTIFHRCQLLIGHVQRERRL